MKLHLQKGDDGIGGADANPFKNWSREFKSGNRPDLYAGSPPLEALKAVISIAASHRPEFSLVHVDVSRAYLHAEAQKLVLVKFASRRLLRKG